MSFVYGKAKFNAMPLEELKEDIEQIFVQNQLQFDQVVAVTDELSYSVSDGSVNSSLKLIRHHYKPLEIEIQAHDKHLRHKKNSAYDEHVPYQTSTSSGEVLAIGPKAYGFVILMILIGYGVYWLFNVLNLIQLQDYLSYIISLVFVGGVLWVGFKKNPWLNKKLDRQKKEFNQFLVSAAIDVLKKNYSEMRDTDVMRCWSCLEILDDPKTCKHCGSAQD